jgi:FkbM family methyltransferase
VKPGAVVLDVGANIGHLSIVLADSLRRDCRVHAIEPYPPNVEKLRLNIALNHLERVILVHPIGLSDSVGKGRMAARSGNCGSATLAATGLESTSVDLTTLDDFASRHRLAMLHFMKIDVEGYEERLLKGGMETITRLRPVLMIELEAARLELTGSSVDRVVSLLHDLSYELFVAQRGRLTRMRESSIGQNPVNAFCVPTGNSTTAETR